MSDFLNNNSQEVNTATDKTIVFDSQKLREMVKRIYDAERRNTKTDNKSDKAMKDMIERIIEEVANKWF